MFSVTDLERLYEGKHHRILVHESLHDFFAVRPRYYYDTDEGDASSCGAHSCGSQQYKSVRFARDGSSDTSGDGHSPTCLWRLLNARNGDSDSLYGYEFFSTSNRSLTSIPEESISLDSTQHCRRPIVPKRTQHVTSSSRQGGELDVTGHCRTWQ